MKVEQVYELTNTIAQELLGESVIVNEDLSNVVDIGKAFENMGDRYDKYVRTLHDHIGKMIFVDRVYRGSSPNIKRDGFEFGSILEKVRADMPNAEENETWELQDRTSYDPNIFYKPTVHAKFFNNRVTFEVPISITEKQVRSAFSNAVQLNAFYSMIYDSVDKAMTVRLDGLIDRTINAGIAETMYDAFPEGTYTGSTVRAVNLLKLYNDSVDQASQLTAQQALRLDNENFLKKCAFIMGKYVDRLKKLSTSYNIGGTEKFTPPEYLHFVLLSDFKRSADVYLQSDTFHNELTKLPDAETVPYWQGEEVEHKIMVTTPTGHDVTLTGIMGVMFDRDAMAVCNMDRRTTTNYNAKAEFWNEWHKMDAQYILDLDENIVVFFIA
jgi:hypothetical protein